MQDVLAALRPVVAALLAEETVDAVVRDGWPRPMVEAGFELHRRTWDLDALAASLRDELALLSPKQPPSTMTHVWPALPGAGVTPMFAAALLGVEVQRVRASSRGKHFAERFAQVWRGVELTDVLDADRVVVSGSDSTVEAIVAQVGAEKVVGYGDRQSFAVVDERSAGSCVDELAADVVMWLGLGCFSAHAVLFEGSESAAGDFAAELAAGIARREAAWHPNPSEAQLAMRMQEMAVAEFETRVWPARLGWVELRDTWDGTARPQDVVVVCPCERWADALAVPPEHRQGVAYCGPRDVSAETFGATRVCAPGALQAPPASWPHDGVSNASALLGFRSGRIGF